MRTERPAPSTWTSPFPSIAAWDLFSWISCFYLLLSLRHLLCSWGWSWTLILLPVPPRAGITGMYHHAWLLSTLSCFLRFIFTLFCMELCGWVQVDMWKSEDSLQASPPTKWFLGLNTGFQVWWLLPLPAGSFLGSLSRLLNLCQLEVKIAAPSSFELNFLNSKWGGVYFRISISCFLFLFLNSLDLSYIFL